MPSSYTMNICELKSTFSDIQYLQKLSELINSLNKKVIPSEKILVAQAVEVNINSAIEVINSIGDDEKRIKRIAQESYSSITAILEKELGLVVKDYYRNLWMSLGIATFGMPLGVIFGLSMGNMGLIGIGLPLGIAIGVAVGSGLDKKALEEGRQL